MHKYNKMKKKKQEKQGNKNNAKYSPINIML